MDEPDARPYLRQQSLKSFGTWCYSLAFLVPMRTCFNHAARLSEFRDPSRVPKKNHLINYGVVPSPVSALDLVAPEPCA